MTKHYDSLSEVPDPKDLSEEELEELKAKLCEMSLTDLDKRLLKSSRPNDSEAAAAYDRKLKLVGPIADKKWVREGSEFRVDKIK